METKFTVEKECQIVKLINLNKNAFCIVFADNKDDVEAYAHLIVSAPDLKQQRDDLLAACEEAIISIREVLSQYGSYDSDGSRIKLPIERQLEAAIKKAQ